MESNLNFNPLFFDKEIKPKPEIQLNKTLMPDDNQIFIKPDNKQLSNNVLFEKYRPQDFNEVIGQNETIRTITNKINNLPHMIFEGPAGTGKTSLIRIITKKLNTEILELNGSDERGIDIIRGKVLTFIRHLSFNGNTKIVFFDEADSMTSEAQLCLRTIIEKYSNNTRFIFACNDINKIIDPIKSRCKTFTFTPISNNDMYNRLYYIAHKEFININDNQLKDIIDNSQGDMRRALNDLQSF